MKMQFSLEELTAIPTMSIGHMDDLKIETKTQRVWISRMTIEDGQPYNNMVTVERLEYINNVPRWQTYKTYEAK